MLNKSTDAKKLSLLDNIGYGMGNLGSNLVFAMVSTYLLYYYTDVFGIGAAAVGTLFFVARLWDAVNDPVMGIVVDKTNTRWGKFRPFILFLTIPTAIVYVLTFTVPNISVTGKLVYAYVTYICLGMLVTSVNIPYHALETRMTKDPMERADVGAVSNLTMAIGQLVVTVITMPLIAKFANPVKGFQGVAAIFGLAMIICYYITFFSTKRYDFPEIDKEQKKKQAQPKYSVKEKLAVIFGNKPCLVLVSSFFIFQFSVAVICSTVIYYFKYVPKNPKLIPPFFLMLLGSLVLGMFTVPVMSRKFGRKNTLVISNILSFIGALGMYLLCSNTTMLLISAFWANFWTASVPALVWGLLPDTVDYAEWQTGIRAEGLIFAALSFMMKAGSAVAGIFIGFTLSLSGYVANAAQTPFALKVITFLAFGVYAISKIILHFVFSKYDLSEEKYTQIINELDERRTNMD